MRSSRATLPLLALLGPTGGGCGQACEGAGCEERFAGALISVIRASDLPGGGETTPLGAYAMIAGDTDQGPEADVALLAGAAWVGTATDGVVRGLDLSAGGELSLADDASVELDGEATGDEFGASVTVIDDWNGDGVADLAVGAPRRDRDAESRDSGALYLYSGLGASLDGDGAQLLRVSGATPEGRLGSQVVACGDLDGDGIGDLAATAPWDSTGGDYAGLVWIGPSAQLLGVGSTAKAEEVGYLLTGAETGERAGSAIACEDDLIGPDGAGPDGVADVVVGAPFASGDSGEAAGAVYVLAGGAGLGSGALPDRATLTLRGPGVNAWQGWSVATGDLDGDGQADLVAGVPGVLRTEDTQARGQAIVWDGSKLSSSTTPRGRILGQGSGDAFGRALSIADLTGDGRADLLVGAPHRDPTGDAAQAYEAGTLYLFRGAEGWEGWSATMSTSDAELRLDATQPYLRTGIGIDAGPLDSDALTDLALEQRYDPDKGVPQ